MTLAVIVGMKSEAACFAGLDDAVIHITGARRERAEALIAEAVAAGCDRLLSAGLAGALDPRLVPGDVVIGDAVLAPDGTRYAADRAWREDLLAVAKGRVEVVVGAVAGVDRVVADAAAKAALHRATDALAVDMESHLVAVAAARAGLRFAVLRAIGDGPGQAVPRAAIAGLGADGGTRPLAVLRALAADPGALPDLVRLARGSARGLRALGRMSE